MSGDFSGYDGGESVFRLREQKDPHPRDELCPIKESTHVTARCLSPKSTMSTHCHGTRNEELRVGISEYDESFSWLCRKVKCLLSPFNPFLNCLTQYFRKISHNKHNGHPTSTQIRVQQDCPDPQSSRRGRLRSRCFDRVSAPSC